MQRVEKIPRTLKSFGFILALGLGLCASSDSAASPTVQVKNIVDFEGVRENQLVGYGLVVGLNKTGDTLKSSPYTQESIISMLERLGVNVRKQDVTSNNIAAVMVTANLPPFARQGSRMDVTVSSIGSAKDLRGGTLLVTPLMGADNEIYAVAQGSLQTGGFSASGKSESSVTKGVPTSGSIANGAIIERETKFTLMGKPTMKLALKNPDFTTAKRIAGAINTALKRNCAVPLDPTTVELMLPTNNSEGLMTFLSSVEQVRVRPDQVAKVIIDEQNGVIVMGENVRISTVAISHGNLTIKVQETPQVSQPNPFSNTGDTTTVERTEISVDEEDKKLGILGASVSLQDLVNGLNALGVGPRDMITILRSIKAAGALQAELEVM